MKSSSRPKALTLLGILLFNSAFILFVCAFAAEQPLGTSGSKSFDPWSPDRKFCGRLVIHLSGAGETASVARNGVKHEHRSMWPQYAELNFRDFYGSDRNSIPSISLLMSSDGKVQKAVKKIATKEAKLLGSAVFFSSEDAFQEFLSSDREISLLQKAIDYFAKTDACKGLMGKDGSVLPYLKTEIVIETEHAPNGIPIWSKKGDTGSKDSYYQQANPKVIDTQLLSKLRNRLGQSVIQTFVETCQGANIGEDLKDNNQCSCWISMTDEKPFLTASLNNASGFSAGLRGGNGGTRPDTVSGSPNAIQMIPKMMASFRTYTPAIHNGRGNWTIFGASDRANPLLSFVYNSADARADSMLRDLANAEIEGSLPRQLADASFTSDIKNALEVGDRQRLANEVNDPAASYSSQLNRVLAITSAIRAGLTAYTKDVREDPNDYSFSEFMTKFAECTELKNPQPKVCAPLSKLINIAAHGTGTDGTQTEHDREIIGERDRFLRAFEQIDVTDTLERYKSGRLSLAELIGQLKPLSDSSEYYLSQLTTYAEEYYHCEWDQDAYKYRHGNLPKELSSALAEMKNNLRNGMYALQQKMFPLLRKEALEVRLSKIEEAAKLLDRHRNELIGNMDPKIELQRLGNDLACLFYYPVGPAFDKIKNNSLPALLPPKSAARSKN